MADQTIEALLKTRDFVPVATAQEAIESDRYTIHDVGVPSELLMESAGAAVAHHVMRALRRNPSAKIIAYIGPGNNGADAVVACRYLLAKGKSCTIILLAEEARFSTALRFQIKLLKAALTKCGLDEKAWFDSDYQRALTNGNDLIVIDGIFGAGLNRAPSGRTGAAIDFINKRRRESSHRCFVVSVDVPSGLSLEAAAQPYSCISADLTVTFGVLKRVHVSEPTKALCGASVAVPIGLFTKTSPTNFFRQRRCALVSLFKPLKITDHKGKFGHVLVLEGHENYLGASRLAARAALRVGAGLVTLACEKNLGATPLDIPEFMKIRRDAISADFMNRVDAVVIGPGLSAEASWLDTARNFLTTWKDALRFLVLDADGLRLLSSQKLGLSNAVIIATPHPKEASNLLGISSSEVENNRFLAIEALGKKNQEYALSIIWILKGATTLVRSLNGEIFALRGESPLLAAGGSGDILSGTIAGLAQQTNAPLAAALLAVSMQIEGARVLSERVKKGCFASELADIFPVITKDRPAQT